MQISIIMLSQTGGHGDDWCICGLERPVLRAAPRPPERRGRRSRRGAQAGARAHPRRRRRHQGGHDGRRARPRDDPRHAHFRDDEIAVMTEEATAAGIHVMAHAQGAGRHQGGLRNGVRSIEHGIFLDDEAIEMMLQRGAWLVPTLHAPRAVIAAAEAGPADPAVVGRQGQVRRRCPPRERRPGPRGRGADRDGHRLRRRTARHQPRGARAHGRGRALAARRRCTRPPARPPSCSTWPGTGARSGRAAATSSRRRRRRRRGQARRAVRSGLPRRRRGAALSEQTVRRTRVERKERTRRAIIDAALVLLRGQQPGRAVAAAGDQGGRHRPDRLLPPLRLDRGPRPGPGRGVVRVAARDAARRTTQRPDVPQHHRQLGEGARRAHPPPARPLRVHRARAGGRATGRA